MALEVSYRTRDVVDYITGARYDIFVTDYTGRLDDTISLGDVLDNSDYADSMCYIFSTELACQLEYQGYDLELVRFDIPQEVHDEVMSCVNFHAGLRVNGEQEIIDITAHQFTYDRLDKPMVFRNQNDWECWVIEQIINNG